MNVTQTLKKWGNGQGVRLPKSVIKAAQLRLDSQLKVTMKGRSILLTPVNNDNKLAKMLAGLTPQIVGGEYDWGDDVGAERFE